MRPLNDDGTWEDKQRKEYVFDKNGNKIYDKKKRTYKCHTVQTTDWNSREKAEEWRKAWADYLNNFLEQRNFTDTVDHRSYARQGKLVKPTIHMGVAATQMERKGKRTIKGDTNREIKVINYKINILLRKLEAIDNKLMQMKELSERDSLALMLMRFHENGIEFSQVRGITLSTLRKASKLRDLSHLIAFVQRHKIRTLAELKERSKYTSEELRLHKEAMKKQQNRIKDIEELLSNYEHYKNNKAVYQEWLSIAKPKKKDKFYNDHRREITLFETAKKYYSQTLGDKKITPKACRNELAELKQAHQNELKEIDRLAEDVSAMETIAYNIDRLAKYEDKQHEVQKKRAYELE